MSSLALTMSLRGQLLSGVSRDAYAVDNYKPELAFDFVGDYFRKDNTRVLFDSALTATRAGNATMVDSDGKIKWAPHNLLTYSEQFDNAVWAKENVTVVSNATVAPDGASTAEKVVENTATAAHIIRQNYTPPSEAVHSFSFYAKAAERTTIRCQIFSSSPLAAADVNLSDGTLSGIVGSAYISNAGNGWYRVTISATVPAAATIFRVYPIVGGASSYAGDGTSGIYLWGAHLYQSSLGGMVNNPDRGDSYVPTTSAARYLPRRGHHIYNGYEWVNEGLLVESEARTNLVTYSEDLTNAAWGATSATKTTSTDSYVRVTSTGVNSFQKVSQSLSLGAGTYTFSFDVRQGSLSYCDIGLSGTNLSGLGYSAVFYKFDFTTKTITQRQNGGALATTVTEIGTNEYRISITLSADTIVASAMHLTWSDNTAGVYTDFRRPQLEAGSTPSSYIPTAGATVTRAAETLVIPSANLPWPAPQYVTGTELVTNGTFDTDTTGWTAGTGLISVSGGQLTVDRNNASKYNCAYQAITTEIGRVYQINIDVVDAGAVGTFKILVSANLSTQDLVNRDVVAGSYTDFFVATTTTTYVHLLPAGTTTNTAIVDNISVREINPLAVSIAMDGRVTYADTGVQVTRDFVSWQFDSNNKIKLYLDTSSTKVGTFVFQQATAAAYSTVFSTFEDYPGVNVPFNIASRHGSTFINGAVDGVALTADLTPVALPDLSATDLQLGYTFMGTIRTFRIWADDIGDAGLVTATNPSTEPSLMLTFDSAETSFVDLGWSE